ncbi:MAG: PASTA domain-containing protein, partial [Candidatus Hydrogenedentes bacterium]|nr:PASTA domain-containing protein [Candidatus Hydrogenedentota bacterium]
MRKSSLLLTGLVFLGMLGGGGAAAALSFDDNATFGDTRMLYGSGENGGFTVDRRNGVEVALRAQLRFGANNQPQNIYNSNGDGTYTFPTGTPDLDLPHPDWATITTPVWNVTFSVNLDHEDRDGTPGSVFTDYTYEVGMDFDPDGTDNWLRFDPIRENGLLGVMGVPDHAFGLYTQASPGVIATTSQGYLDALNAFNITQNTTNPEFINMDLTSYGMGDYSGFDPNVDGVYDIYLAVFSGATEIARSSIKVIVGNPPIAPNVINDTREEAEQAILDAGLTVGPPAYQYDASVPAGTVIGQIPPSGTELEPGQEVILILSSGPEPVYIPEPVTFGDISTGPSDPQTMLYGSNINGAFTVGRGNGVELGLRAQLRFDENNNSRNIFNSNNDGTYRFPAGTPNLALPHPDWATTTTPVWNVTYAINTDFEDRDGTPSAVLGDYTYEVGIDFDPEGTDNWLRFDPVSPSGLFAVLGVPDHSFGLYTQQSPGLTAATGPDYAALLSSTNILHNTSNPEFVNMDLTEYGMGDFSTFDPNQEGVYTVYLAAFDGGVEIARTEIRVIIENPLVAPNVTGMARAEAETALAALGLTLGTVNYAHSDTVPVGAVISQTPLPGTEMVPGGAVSVVLSSGPEPYVIPEPVTFGDISTGPSDPQQLLPGSGMINGAFTVDRNAGVELGLRAQLRFDANNNPANIFNYDGAGVYTFAPGTPNLALPHPDWAAATTPVWNVVFSVNTDFDDRDGTPAATLADYTYEVGIDFDPSPGTGNWLAFDPISSSGMFNVLGVPDHAFGLYTQQSPGLTAATVPDYEALLTSTNIVQNAANAEFFNSDFTEYGYGDYSGFDPNQEGVYTIYLAAFDDGAEVARTEIQVVVGTAAATAPDVVGLPQADAAAAITAAGFAVGTVANHWNDTVPVGAVVSQDPAAGTVMAAGQAVSLVVSAGPQPPFEPEPVTFGDISEGPSDPMRMLYGAGTNGSFTVGRGGGVEVGLRGQLRFDANNQPRDIYNNNFDGTYSFPTGTPNLSLPRPPWATTTTPVWNVVLAVNTDYEDRDGTPAATLADYTYELGVDFDPSAGTDNWLVFDPISSNGLFNTLGVPDHALGLYTQQSPGIIATTPSNYAAAIATCNIAQNTGNVEFMNLDLSEYGYGDFSGFDPNEPGVYNVYLAAFDGGVEIARTEIQILVGDPILAPDVVGLAEADAAAAITGAGLVVGTTDLHWSDTVPAGDVVSQDPAPDTVMTAGQAVNLVVSAGPQPPFEPEPVTFGDISVGPNDPMQMLFGSGNANGAFTVGRGDGVELGLRAQLRFDANNQPQNIFNSNGDGTYSFPTGTPNLALPHPSWASETTPVWSVAFAVNTDDTDRDGTPSSVLADYTFEAGIDFDPAGTGNWLVFDPISDNGLFNTLGVPDHAFGVYTQQHPGLTAATPADYTTLLASANIVQNAANYEFLNMDLTEYGYGNYTGFDPNVPGVYTVYLAALSGGVEVARTEIQVVVGDVISVPNLAGMTLEQAETELTGAGLILGTVTSVYSDAVPAGEIISQDPAAGAAAGAGDAVNVVISLGPEPVAVPNVVGLTQAAAEAALTGAGLTLGAVTESYSDTVPAGQVMSQTPAAGTEVLPNTAVDIEVSLGPEPVAVPDVVGLTQAAAEAALTGAGLTLGAVTESYS